MGEIMRRPRPGSRAAAAALALFVAGCTQTFDAGSSRPHGRLPVDERNPVVLLNDGVFDNWQGEYAVLLANGGGPKLAGIVVGTSPPWPNLETNVNGWRRLVTAARASGLDGIPDPVASVRRPLERPVNGDIDATSPNRSEGARFIVETSSRLSLPYRPLAVVTGGPLTDVADAYLLDPTVVERVVVVASLGTVSASGGAMGIPNGEMDPWAATIVVSRFRYVQVSAYYDQLTDVPASRVGELPANPLGEWIAAKRLEVWSVPVAADQVAVTAVGLPSFAVAVDRVAPAAPVGVGATSGPDLITDPSGRAWLVTESNGAAATTRFWELLGDPSTYTQ
jgi:hypothetical protein